MVNSISILGCTGSIGRQTIAVAEHIGMRVAALTANRKIDLLEEQARRLKPEFVAVYDEDAAKQFRIAVADTDIRVGSGMAGLIEAATLASSDCVVTAVSGAVGLKPTLAAIDEKKRIALANKETLVCAGSIVMRRAAETGAEIVPVDSEHSAIFQCFLGNDPWEAERIWLTASGGPFFGKTREELLHVDARQALNHPNWSMGAKVTTDSSTLMNKGLEAIEAHHLFDAPFSMIHPVVQRQSAVHSMVEYSDGSVISHIGAADMRVPIQYALSFPARWSKPTASLDFAALGHIDFAEPDYETFGCLRLALEAGERGGILPCVLNASDEIAVDAFLHGRIAYLDIERVVGCTLEAFEADRVESLEQLEDVDARARAEAARVVSEL